MNLKIRYLFPLFILLVSLSLSAQKKPENFIDSEFFIKSISDVLLQDKPDLLIVKAAPFLKDKEVSGIPNCFPCSLYLLRSTFHANAGMQLVAADLAIKFSPDLPEAHIHYLSRLAKFAPFRFDHIGKELPATIKSFFNFPSRDAFFYSIMDCLIKGCVLFMILFFIILFLKYATIAYHKYLHLVGNSSFYALSLLLVFVISAWMLSRDELNYTLVLLTVLMFLSSFALIREKIFLYLSFLVCVVAQSGIILTGANEESSINKMTAINHLGAIFSPASVSQKDLNADLPGGSMAKGYLFYYSGNYKKAVFYLKKELATINEGEIKASLENVIGLSYAAMGNYKEAIDSLKSSYNYSRNIGTGYNLSKVLYEGGMTEDGSTLERSILEKAGDVTLSYASLELPPMYKIWRFVTSGKTASRFENMVKFFLFIIGNLFFFIFLTLIRINYLKNLKLTRCLECGSVICSKCNGGGEHVCAVCRLMKAAPDVFKEGEKQIYEKKRERFFAKESVLSLVLNLLIPGGGLIYSNRVIEGTFYLTAIITVLAQLTQNEMGLYYMNTGNSEVVKVLAITGTVILYLISIIRGYVVSRGD